MSWFDNAMVLRDFATAMVEAGVTEDTSPILHKPYRFTSEYSIWKSAGYPASEDDEGWEVFIQGLNNLNEDEDGEDEDET